MTNVTVVGGGSSAYTVIALLSQAGHKVSLLTSKPELWDKNIAVDIVGVNGEVKSTLEGELCRVDNEYAELVSDAEVIIVCTPVSSYKEIFEKICQSIKKIKSKKICVGVVYGQGGVNWIWEYLLDLYGVRDQINYWAIGLLPWICRTHIYGKSAFNYGGKKKNLIAASSDECFNFISSEILPAFEIKNLSFGSFHRADSFLSLTLSVDNQIIHPSRCFAIFEDYPDGWAVDEEIPYFYRDFDDKSARYLSLIDAEYSLIKERIKNISGNKFIHMMNYMNLEEYSYGSPAFDIKSSFCNSRTLWSIKPPIFKNNDRIKLDFNHRFFWDDIFFGLCIARWFGDKLDVKTVLIDKIIKWALSEMQKQDINVKDIDYALPNAYGFYSVEDILELKVV